MRHFIACLFVGSLLVAGCHGGHPSVPPMGSDSGPLPMGDAGVMLAPDSGPAMPDAGPSAPELAFELDSPPSSAILVAGGDVWHDVSSYRSDAVLDRIHVTMRGDAADVSRVAIFDRETLTMLGQDTLPSGVDSSRWVEVAPATLMSDGFYRYILMATIPAVLSHASAGTSDHLGSPFSGDAFRLGVDAVRTADGEASFAALLGNEFVIRRSRPLLTSQALSSTTISNGLDQDLNRWQASADSAGSIALFRNGLRMEINSAAGTICELALRKGSTDLSPDDYFIRGPEGRLNEGDCLDASVETVTIYFLGGDGDTVTGSGNVYTLHGLVNGFVPGDTIVSSLQTEDDTIVTGYLAIATEVDMILDLSPYGSPGTGSTRDMVFGWSDLSEVPSSALAGNRGGSRDWTNSYLVPVALMTTTLTR